MLDASQLPLLNVGDRVRIVCPTCNGGTDHERSLLVSRDQIRTSWHCFRASCPERGGILSPGVILDDKPVEREVRPYQGATRLLDEAMLTRISDEYGVVATDWRMTDDGRFLLPICSPVGVIRGHVLRKPWWDKGNFEVPKTVTYWNMAGPLLAWYMKQGARDVGRVLLVEDQLSAMVANEQLDVTACALLGTGVNAEKIAEIQSVSGDVVIALDADATGQAFAMARKWGQAFRSCRVVVLSQDLKDMSYRDLTKLPI